MVHKYALRQTHTDKRKINLFIFFLEYVSSLSGAWKALENIVVIFPPRDSSLIIDTIYPLSWSTEVYWAADICRLQRRYFLFSRGPRDGGQSNTAF